MHVKPELLCCCCARGPYHHHHIFFSVLPAATFFVRFPFAQSGLAAAAATTKKLVFPRATITRRIIRDTFEILHPLLLCVFVVVVLWQYPSRPTNMIIKHSRPRALIPFFPNFYRELTCSKVDNNVRHNECHCVSVAENHCQGIKSFFGGSGGDIDDDRVCC